MASPENATSVSLRPEGVDEDGRKIPGHEDHERNHELLDTARPGLELSRALDRADSMAVFIEAVQEQIDQEHGIDEDLWTELRDDLLARGAPRER